MQERRVPSSAQVTKNLGGVGDLGERQYSQDCADIHDLVPGWLTLPGWKPLVDTLMHLFIPDEGAWPKPSRPFWPYQPRAALMILWIMGGVAFLILCLSRLMGVHLAVTHDGTRCF
jgi:hypothetical protein